MRRHPGRVRAFREVENRVLARTLPDAEEHEVGWRGGSVRVVDAGAGPPIVFLHGITGTLTNFASLASDLASTHRCLLFDLPGHGLSGPLDLAGSSPRDVLVEAVASVTEELVGDKRSTIVGNSLGGMTALYVAADRPAAVGAVAILGEPAYAFPGARAVFPLSAIGLPFLGRLTLSARAPRSMYARTVRPGFGAPALEAMGRDALDADRLGVWAGGHADSVADLMRALMGRRGLAADGVALRHDDYDRIDVPLWFLWGNGDPFMSPESGRPWVERFAAATLDVVDGGHLPWFDTPALSSRKIRDLAAPAGR